MEKFALLIILFVAFATDRFHLTSMPIVISEILMDIIIGKIDFNIVQPDTSIQCISNLGVIMLIFLGGMEIEFSLLELKKDPTIYSAVQQ